MADQKNNLALGPRQEQHRNPSSPTSTVDAESANPLKGANVAAKDDVERAGPNTAASWWRYLNEDVDTTQTTSQLALYCFMTGYMCVFTRYILCNTPAHTTSKEMSSPSPQFSFGAVSKRVTLPRYLLIYLLRLSQDPRFLSPSLLSP